MCGIAGIYGAGDIRAMTRILGHRGPDDEGFYRDGEVQLGAKRLAIIDLAGGHQPMTGTRGNAWIVSNGELFNYLEIRAELEAKGHRFLTSSDTETMLNAYAEWGPRCLDRFIGMFAFAIWDGRTLFLARDRLGEKPLFWARRGSRFLFASEIKALLQEMPAEPNLDDRFPVLEWVQEPETLFKGIFSLQPGHFLTFDGATLSISKYWDLPAGETDALSEHEAADALRALLEDAVRLRIRADVPVGLFLSGGLDSSLIGALARPATVFTCRLPYGPAFDEHEHALTMARALGVEPVVVTVTAAELQSQFPRMVWHMEQPVATASTVAEFALAKAASGCVKVVLGGQGADEAFGGYVRHLLLAEERRLAGAAILRDYHPLARVLWGSRMFADPAQRYFELLHRGVGRAEPMLDTARALFARHHGSIVNQMGAVDFALTFPSLVAMNDRAAAAYGLENRTPFLDHRILEFAFRLPSGMRIRDLTTKLLLRKVARGLVPASIVDRPDKKGLAVPIGQWLSGELKPWAEELAASLSRRGIQIQPRSERGEFDRSMFTRVSLELWFRTFIDRRADGPVG